MNKSQSKIVKFFKSNWVISVIAPSVITLAVAGSNLLLVDICVPVWLIAIVGVAPILIIYMLKLVFSCFKRLYKTGDTVVVLGDSRHFIVAEYHRWKPYYVKLLRKGGDSAILVHHRFLDFAKKEENPFVSFLEGKPPGAAKAIIRDL